MNDVEIDNNTIGDPVSAAFGLVSNGRLVFAADVSGFKLQGNPRLTVVYQAHLLHDQPNVRVQGTTVIVQVGNFLRFAEQADEQRAMASVVLNSALLWEIELRGETARLSADLQTLRLRALDLRNISESAITLPKPSGTVYVYIAGSVRDVTIWSPKGTAVRLQIGGRTSNLRWHQQRFDFADGVNWQSQDYQQMRDRYDISIAGNATNLTIAA